MEPRHMPFAAAPAPAAARVLVFAPHPDDEVFGCGGTLAQHVAAGAVVQVIIVSDGGHGPDDSARADYVATREAESRAAAQQLGYPPPLFWRLPDRGLEYGEALIERLQAAIAACAADLVYAPGLQEIHPDHRALAMAAVEAVRRQAAALPDLRLACYEVGIAQSQPNLLVDISTQIASKQAAMACFVSQLSKQAYDQQIAALNRYRTYTLPSTVQAAEALLVTPARQLHQLALCTLFASEHQRQQALGAPQSSDDLPLVSVLVRSTDRPTLHRALDSVALQTYPHVEVVLVNAIGNSHAAYGPQCGRFPLRQINAPDGRPLARASAANVALDHAAGACLLFLDDDDWLAPDHLAKLVGALQNHHRAQRRGYAVHTAVACVDNQGAAAGPVFATPYDAGLQMMSNHLPIHGVLFARAALERGCRFDESLEVFEDWDFWLQVGRLGDIAFVPGVSAYYRIHVSSGVHGQSPIQSEASRRIYRKWLPQWREDDVVHLCQALWRSERQHEADQQALAAAAARHQALQADHQQQAEAIAALQAEVSRRLDELHTLYHSLSWRLTAPLRKLLQCLRGER